MIRKTPVQKNTPQVSVYNCLQKNSAFPSEYILPTIIKNDIFKISIIDPLKPVEYRLPVSNEIVSEIVTPSLEHTVPITDPALFPVVEKQAAWLVKQRHRKMKNHQRRKFRKRMKFVLRAMKLRRTKRREAKLQAELKRIQDIGDNFNAEQFVREKLELSRQGGYKLDIFKS